MHVVWWAEGELVSCTKQQVFHGECWEGVVFHADVNMHGSRRFLINCVSTCLHLILSLCRGFIGSMQRGFGTLIAFIDCFGHTL